ncbi:MAG TPA: hypothetical protein VFW11_18140 [Cyclobacteriaceae bacterium]|nr:hypothetical protein [Cyclobacteriaceae bacterium]
MKLLRSIFNLLHFNKKNWRAIALCILAATIFWFFNALNKNYTTTISFPLQFDYDARHYIPVKPLQDELRINVTGMGWDIFRRSIGLRKHPLIIPIERPVTVKKIVGSTLPALFSSQIEALQINFVVNDTLYLDIQARGRRWLSLSSDSIPKKVDHNFGIIGPINIRPDSVLVEGPLDIIKKLKEPFPIELESHNINDDFNEGIELNISDNRLINVTPAEINISFHVERFVEITDTVGLELKNIPKNAQPKMDVSRVPATLRLQQSKIGTFPWDSVKAVVDLRTFNKGSIKVRPELIGLPEYAQLIKIDTIRITY